MKCETPTPQLQKPSSKRKLQPTMAEQVATKRSEDSCCLVLSGVPLRVPLRVTIRVPQRVPLRVTIRGYYKGSFKGSFKGYYKGYYSGYTIGV